MMTRYPHLFQPIRIGKTVLKNRITNAPIYNFLASWDNHVTREGIEFSKPFGKGGAATVTLGSGFINRVLPPAALHIVGLHDDFMVVYLSEWCEAVRRFGAKIFGRQRLTLVLYQGLLLYCLQNFTGTV